MNAGQSQFLNFFLAAANPQDKAQAQQLLEASFHDQDNGTFDVAAFDELRAKIMPLIQPDQQQRVLDVLLEFRAQLKK